MPLERTATIRDLLMARSGVYHRAANEGDASALAPPRGSVKPGSYFLYNTWDFNALGTIHERETGRDFYKAFEGDIAHPIASRTTSSQGKQSATTLTSPTILPAISCYRRATWLPWVS